MFFKNITGQESAKAYLRQSVVNQRISHAQLFSEREGYGALPLAIAYAAYINCPNRTEEDACGTCPSCVKFKKFSHPDLHFVYPTIKTDNKRISKDYFKEWLELLNENNAYCTFAKWIEKLEANNKQAIISVEEAEQLIKTLSYKSYEAEYKVVVLWLIEKLQHQAAPKLLKILEEPPEKTLFLLITEASDEILSTIKSRTQLLRIPPIEKGKLETALQLHFPDNDHNTISRVAALSEGSWSQAQNLMEHNEQEKEFFNLFVEWMRICYVSDMQKALDLSEQFAKMGREVQKNFFAYALELLHSFVQYHTGGAETVKTGDEEKAFIVKFAPYINLRNVALFAEAFEKAISHIERNANQTILFMDISVQIMPWIYKEKR
ncbi:MAG: DNA polymerase III subunit delta [Bacteroidales bacterium]|nr:DNA polymerase III subunit delta [Bacteroidales bacterium]